MEKKQSEIEKDSDRPFDRYPHSALFVSDFAQQAYCEQQLDLWLQNPGELTSVPAGMEEMEAALAQFAKVNIGSLFHESMTQGAAAIDWEEAKELLRAGESLTMLESQLSGEYRELPIVGRPDAICFDGWQASMVIEYKVTDATQLYPNHRVQLLLYGYLLQQQTFDIDNLVLVCALVPRRDKEWINNISPQQAQELVARIEREMRALTARAGLRWRDLYHPGLRLAGGVAVRLRAFRYTKREALKYLASFSEYWLGQRAPEPTTNANKCRCCLYNAARLCPVPQAPYRE